MGAWGVLQALKWDLRLWVEKAVLEVALALATIMWCALAVGAAIVAVKAVWWIL
jgi:hypothetical protein